MLPMAVPGMVLGLGYIFFFNAPGNPLNVLYQTMALLVLSTIVHYYTSSHLTAVTALKALDDEFEAVSASLKVPFYKTFLRVTVPVCLPAILDIARYFFINAMATISAVVFLYSPDTKLASVAILEPRRGRRDRRGGGDGDADRRDVDGRDAALHALRRACCCAARRRGASAALTHRPRQGEPMSNFEPRSDPADPRPADDVAARPSARCCATGARGMPTFNAVTASVRERLLDIVHGGEHARRACRCRAAARSRSRRRSTRSCRATATCWCCDNGAYGKRIAKLCEMMGRRIDDVRDGRGRAVDGRGRRRGCSPPIRRSPTSA